MGSLLPNSRTPMNGALLLTSLVIQGKAPSNGVFWLFHRGDRTKSALHPLPLKSFRWTDDCDMHQKKQRRNAACFARAHQLTCAESSHSCLDRWRLNRIEHCTATRWPFQSSCLTRRIFGRGRSSYLRFKIFSKVERHSPIMNLNRLWPKWTKAKLEHIHYRKALWNGFQVQHLDIHQRQYIQPNVQMDSTFVFIPLSLAKFHHCPFAPE